MTVLLVNPSQVKIYGKMRPPVQLHMGLAYIAAMLKKCGHLVSIMDMDAEHVSLGSFSQFVKSSMFDMVGVTVTTPTLSSSLELARAVKESYPASKVVFGGMHPSVMPRETITYKEVDFVVKGEGEITLIELLNALANGNNIKDVNGILFKEDNGIIETPSRDLIEDLDTIPFPARDLFKNSSYTYPDSLYSKTAPIITSRGCPGRCTYCNASSIFGRKFRARSSANIVDEIELLIKDHGIKEIHIWDDNFVTNKERVYEIRDEIKKRGVSVKFAFPNGIRADYLDIDILSALKDMGTYSIAIGVESGSQEVLNKARKGIRLDKVAEVFTLAKEIGLETWAFFMFGLPGEDPGKAIETINFAKRLNPDIAKFHILKPYPGTEVYNFMVFENLLTGKDYDNYGIHTAPVHHIEGLSENELLEIQKKAYFEFYFRPSKILGQILRIKSFNRLRLNLESALGIAKIIMKN